jgi:hypothetical protein
MSKKSRSPGLVLHGLADLLFDEGKKVEDEGGEFGTAGCQGLLCSVSVPRGVGQMPLFTASTLGFHRRARRNASAATLGAANGVWLFVGAPRLQRCRTSRSSLYAHDLLDVQRHRA